MNVRRYYRLCESGMEFGAAETRVGQQQQPSPTSQPLRARGLARGKPLPGPVAIPDKYSDDDPALESLTGTGAIAYAPLAMPLRRRTPKRRTPAGEKQTMRQRRRQFNEENQNGVAPLPGPGLKGEGHRMDSPGGNGVAERTPTKSTVGKFDTALHDMSQQWPGNQKGNLAMAVHPEGPGGDHESSHGEPSDGHTKSIGEAWPRKQKNVGSGVAEPVHDYDEAGVEDGDGPSEISLDEGWSPGLVGQLMDPDGYEAPQLQQLFNCYADSVDCVRLEGFSQLLQAHGASNQLTETQLQQLMQHNQQYLFYEGQDPHGRYWVVEPAQKRPAKPVTESATGPRGARRAASAGDEAGRGWLQVADHIQQLQRQQRVGRRTMLEALQLSYNVHLDRDQLRRCSRQTRAEIGRLVEHYDLRLDSQLQQLKEAGPDMQVTGPAGAGVSPEPDMDNDYVSFGPGYPDELGDGVPDELGDDDFEGYGEPGMHSSELADPNTMDPGRMADNGEFDDFGLEDESDLPIPGLQSPTRPGQPTAPGRMGGAGRMGMEGRRRSGALTEDLQGAGHQMDQEGEFLDEQELSHDSGLPEQETDLKELHGQNLLGAKQTNTGEGQTRFANGGMGTMEENVQRITQVVRNGLRQVATGLPAKSRCESYCLLVREQDGSCNRTNSHRGLTEAVVDAEELLQLLHPNRVRLEARFVLPDGRKLQRQVSLPKIVKRAPMVSEGATVFRFNRVAEAFAAGLLREGKACRVTSHNWGAAVSAPLKNRERVRLFYNLAL